MASNLKCSSRTLQMLSLALGKQPEENKNDKSPGVMISKNEQGQSDSTAIPDNNLISRDNHPTDNHPNIEHNMSLDYEPCSSNVHTFNITKQFGSDDFPSVSTSEILASSVFNTTGELIVQNNNFKEFDSSQSDIDEVIIITEIWAQSAQCTTSDQLEEMPYNKNIQEKLSQPMLIEEAANMPGSEDQTKLQHEINVEDENEFTKKGTKRIRKIKLNKTTKKDKIMKLAENHQTKDACNNCRYKCTNSFSEEWRKKINIEFWEKTWSERKNFVVMCVTKIPVKRRRGESKARTNSFCYFFNNVDGERIRVCKWFFLTTLGFSKENNSVVYDAVTAIDKPSKTGMTYNIQDQRGKHPNKNKKDHSVIKKHIESYNPTISHYRREHAPNRRYLPSELTINRMHNDFQKSEGSFECSYDLYRQQIKDMGISFTKLGHEECGLCSVFKEHNKDHKEDSPRDDCEVCLDWKSHKERAKKSRQLYKTQSNLEMSSDDKVYFCADLQKVIMLPRMDSFKEAVFAKRMVVFNESFVPLGSRKKVLPLAVLWYEAVTGRKKEDIINSFYAFFLYHRDTNQISLWLDNCSGQNKNWTFFTFLVFLVNACPEVSIDTVEIFYFEPGHTFMAADAFHHQVELAMKQCGKVFDFHDFEKCVQKANSGKVNVKTLGVDDLFSWKDFTSYQKLKNLGGSRPYLKNIVKVKVQRGQFSLMYSTNYDDPPDKELNFLQAKCISPRAFPIPTKTGKVRGFNKLKKKLLIEKLCPLMPENRRAFWINLPESDVPDLLDSHE